MYIQERTCTCTCTSFYAQYKYTSGRWHRVVNCTHLTIANLTFGSDTWPCLVSFDSYTLEDPWYTYTHKPRCWATPTAKPTGLANGTVIFLPPMPLPARAVWLTYTRCTCMYMYIQLPDWDLHTAARQRPTVHVHVYKYMYIHTAYM